MKVTILEESYPTDLSVQYFMVPTHCSFKNIKFENNIGVDDPSLLQTDLIDEQPIDTIVEEDITKEEVNATTTGEGTL